MSRALERLLLLGFGAARNIFLLQGFAFAVAWLATRSLAPADAPPWLHDVLVFALLLSLLFFAAGLLLVAAGRWPAAVGGPEQPAWPWPPLLGLTLLACSALAAFAGAGLPALWGEIGAQLDAIGFWEGLARPDPFGGIVLLPLLLALSVPALVTAAALAQLVLPLLLLPLLAARSRRFPELLARGAISQSALVLGAWLATRAATELARHALAAMAGAQDAEVTHVAELLAEWLQLLGAATGALFAPLLGMLVWLAFVRPATAAAAHFTAGGRARPEPTPALPPGAPAPLRAKMPRSAAPAPSPLPVARPAPPNFSPARPARLALTGLGAALLLFGLVDALRTRPTFASAEPAPGEELATPPAVLRLRFDAALDPASALSLTKLVLPPYTGEQTQEIELARSAVASDPQQRTLVATPASALPAGVYRVSWTALPARGGVSRHGSFAFGVGRPVPEDDAGRTYSLQDRDAGARARRKTFAGGALLLGLGMLLPVFSPRR